MTDPTADRPLVTFALFAYNQEQYIREAVEGAFAQTYEPLEIILSDDCSSDRTFEIMQEMAAAYEGPHRVILNRTELNRGLARHINEVMQRASGDFVIMAAGDDISIAERTDLIVSGFQVCAGIFAVFTDFIEIAAKISQNNSVRVNFLDDLNMAYNAGGVGRGATYAYRKECFFNPRSIPNHVLSEDRILPLRASIYGKVAYLDCQTVQYRQPPESLGTRLRLSGNVSFQNRAHIQTLRDDVKLIKGDKGLPNAKAKLLIILIYTRFFVSQKFDFKSKTVFFVMATFQRAVNSIIVRILRLRMRGSLIIHFRK